MKIRNFTYLFIFSLSVAGGLSVFNKEFGFLSAATYTLALYVLLAVTIFALAKLKWEFKTESIYHKIICWLFFTYIVTMMLRGLPKDYTNVKELLQSDYLFWVFIIPVLLFFDKRLLTMAYLMNAIYFLGIFFLLMCIVRPTFVTNRETAEPFIHPFAFGCGFLLLNARYLSKAKKAVAFLALVVGLVSFIYLARRNGIVSYGGLIFASFALNAKYLSASRLFRIFPIIAGVLVIGLLSADKLPSSLTEKLSDRLTEDSRSLIFDYFFEEMETHKAVGKGMQGNFYYPEGGGKDEYGEDRDIRFFRNGIENGYLQLYLNGGFVYITLFILILLPAACLGIFKGRNQFVQASGVIVFLWLLDMAVYGLPRLTLEYLLVWICAGICYKTSLRETPDEEITEFFKNFKEDESTLVYEHTV